MTQHPRPYLISEGQFTLPANYHDRTVNAFVPVAPAPAINVSRDYLATGEDAAAYLTRQLDQLIPHMQGWLQHLREPVALGNGLLTGEIIHISFLRENARIAQMQAIFAVDSVRVLVFSISKMGEITAAESKLLRDMLSSFRFHGEG